MATRKWAHNRHKEVYEQSVKFTVDKHIAGLRRLVAYNKITETDHDMIGEILTKHIGNLIGLSDLGWETFKYIIDDSRKVHYE